MAMHIAMQSMLRDGNVNNAIAAAQEAYPTIPMKPSTVDSKFRVLQKSMANNQDVNVWNDLSLFDRARVDVLDADVRKVKGSLTTVADRDFLQSLATVRDNRNAGMGRKEIIAIISNMQGVPLKTAENHYDHLIRSKQLKELKKDGRVVTAQPTTTNRTAITTEKLLRTYCTQEEAWKEQAELNGWDESKMTASQLEAHKAVKDAHTMNLDESSYLASDGVVNVIGGRGKKKHEKNMADCRESITVVRVGSSSGVDGPRVYLAKGKEIELNSFKDFTANYKAPHGSHIVMTPIAYMTDEAWRELVPKLCEGIRAMDRVIPNCLF